jgi:hypothetical protein
VLNKIYIHEEIKNIKFRGMIATIQFRKFWLAVSALFILTFIVMSRQRTITVLPSHHGAVLPKGKGVSMHGPETWRQGNKTSHIRPR